MAIFNPYLFCPEILTDRLGIKKSANGCVESSIRSEYPYLRGPKTPISHLSSVIVLAVDEDQSFSLAAVWHGIINVTKSARFVENLKVGQMLQ